MRQFQEKRMKHQKGREKEEIRNYTGLQRLRGWTKVQWQSVKFELYYFVSETHTKFSVSYQFCI